MTTNQNPEKGALLCEAWEAMLTDALDGTLTAADAAAFTAHSDGCVACGGLLEEAKRGTEWLQFLHETPPAPNGLVERILAGTSGLPQAGPLLPAGAAAIPHQPWLGMPLQLLQRGILRGHVAESRIVMTLAMAFFSIALTLNLTNVRLNQLRLSDLKPTAVAASLTHEFFATSKNVQRYYSNLRFVYEVESRLNEIRQTPEGPAPAAAQPQQSRPEAAQPSPQPGHNQQPSSPLPAGKNGGSARKDSPGTRAPRGLVSQYPPAVLAHFFFPQDSPGSQHAAIRLFCLSQLPYPGTTQLKSERSLV